MLGTLVLRDYRCFKRETPVRLDIRRGFTSFLGPNNGGKSALIRSLQELRQLFTTFLAVQNGNAQSVLQTLHTFNRSSGMYDTAEIVNERDDPKCDVELILDKGSFSSDAKFVTRVLFEFTSDGSQFRMRPFINDEVELGLNGNGSHCHDTLAEDDRVGIRTAGLGTIDVTCMAILCDALSRVMYIGPFRNAINEGAAGHYDIQVGTGFVAQWDTWKTGPERTKNRAIEKVTADVQRLLEAQSLEVTSASGGKTLQVSIDRRPHKLSEIGSGVSQLIVVLGNAAVRRPSFVAIDEPECHLHPGLQHDFLTTLASYCELGVFFATHSVGLARSISDYPYVVERRVESSIVRSPERVPRYAEFLGSMGIAALQEIGWDSVLLVEGTKDVRTFQQWLRTLNLNRRVIVLPLGGGSMIHGKHHLELAEIRRLSERVYALVDSERISHGAPLEEGRQEFLEACAELGIPCLATAWRAIENYVSQIAADAAYDKKAQVLGPYDDPKKFPWGKSETWRAARYMGKAELLATDIGQFLQKMTI